MKNQTVSEGSLADVGLDPHELAARDFPKYRTVLVAAGDEQMRTGAAASASQAMMYEGMGYVKLSDNPKYTGHGGLVLMGIPHDVYEQKARGKGPVTFRQPVGPVEDVSPDGVHMKMEPSAQSVSMEALAADMPS